MKSEKTKKLFDHYKNNLFINLYHFVKTCRTPETRTFMYVNF